MQAPFGPTLVWLCIFHGKRRRDDVSYRIIHVHDDGADAAAAAVIYHFFDTAVTSICTDKSLLYLQH